MERVRGDCVLTVCMRTLAGVGSDGLAVAQEEREAAALALGDVAAVVGMSPGHFAKKFRHSTGLSLHRFANYRRIRRSWNLLRDTEAPLAAVARALGFASHSHFTRVFHQLTGMTPARYRDQFRLVIG